jgi:hypothetical protein
VSDAPTFTITLHHLAPGAKQAGVTFPDTELPGVSEKKLHELIRQLGSLASTNLGSAAPEMRVAAPLGQFVVKISEGRLRVNSWAIKIGGANLSPDQIFGVITGAGAEAEVPAAEVYEVMGKRSRGGIIALLVVLTVGINALTAWMLTQPQPPAPMLPDFTPLAREPAERFVAEIAGEYRTGPGEGARGLKVGKDGRVHWVRFGPAGAVAEDTEVAVKPVQSRSKPALLADGRTLIETDATASLVFYNEIYRRKAP